MLCNQQIEKSAAAFGEANWKFTDTTTFTLGAVDPDKKDWTGRQQARAAAALSPTGAIDPAFLAAAGNLMNAADFNAYPFRVVRQAH